MDLFHEIVQIVFHAKDWLQTQAGVLGPWVYLLLFVVVFCETGLVVTPILPGDSLLFAVGALAASDGSPLRLEVLIVLLISAAVLGDAVNYFLGFWIGPRVFTS